MHKMQGAKCATNNLVYGSSVCTGDDFSQFKLVAYRSERTDEPYTNSYTCFRHS